jgi:hypothetical protein
VCHHLQIYYMLKMLCLSYSNFLIVLDLMHFGSYNDLVDRKFFLLSSFGVSDIYFISISSGASLARRDFLWKLFYKERWSDTVTERESEMRFGSSQPFVVFNCPSIFYFMTIVQLDAAEMSNGENVSWFV